MSAAATDTSCFGETSTKSTLSARHQQHVAMMTNRDQLFGELAVLGQRHIRLGDMMLGLLDRRQIAHLVGDLAVHHPPVRRLDEAVFVDPRIGRERIDEADIRPLRRLDRADPAIMRRMDVAHLETGTLAGQPSRTERRQPPLVGDLGQGIGLIHELRQLRGAEELPDRRRRRLGVDKVVRHHRVDVDRRHALLDGPLHAHQAEPVLVLHELADRADAPIAQMIDIVDLALAVAQIGKRLHHRQDVLLAQRAHGIRAVELEPHVHLDPADRRQIVALLVEQEPVEQRLRRSRESAARRDA